MKGGTDAKLLESNIEKKDKQVKSQKKRYAQIYESWDKMRKPMKVQDQLLIHGDYPKISRRCLMNWLWG